jgi:Lamin-B receptor of TUDOR domain
MSGFQPGERILAQWNGGAFWFPGTVHSVNGSSVAVQYDDGMSDIRPGNQVRPFDWVVGSRISAIWSGNGQWYAARIMEMDEDRRSFVVRFDDGIREERPSALCRCEEASGQAGAASLH